MHTGAQISTLGPTLYQKSIFSAETRKVKIKHGPEKYKLQSKKDHLEEKLHYFSIFAVK